MSDSQIINGHSPVIAPATVTTDVAAQPMPAPIPAPRPWPPAVPAATASPAPTVRRPATRPATQPVKPVRWWHKLHGTALLGTLFYSVVLVIALAGGAQGAEGWLGWHIALCFVVVAAVELGGVYLSVMAEERRQMGEKAYAARIGSLLVATGAVGLNWFGHADHPIQAGVFAGFSGGGYAIWIIRAGQKRRDARRAAGHMDVIPPDYGIVRWIRHPALTHRAQTLALQSPDLGLQGSLARAAADIADEARRKKIVRLVKGDLAKVYGSAYAELVLDIADPQEFFAAMEERTDWKGMVAVYADRLDPSKLAAEARKRGRKVAIVTTQPSARQTNDERATTEPAPRGSATGTARSVPATSTRSRTVSRAVEDARGGWWTAAREQFYGGRYAQVLTDEGKEIGGTELAAGLGLDPGGARTQRNTRLRDRYAREVVEGARVPRAELPDVIVEKIRALEAQTAR